MFDVASKTSSPLPVPCCGVVDGDVVGGAVTDGIETGGGALPVGASDGSREGAGVGAGDGSREGGGVGSPVVVTRVGGGSVGEAVGTGVESDPVGGVAGGAVGVKRASVTTKVASCDPRSSPLAFAALHT